MVVLLLSGALSLYSAEALLWRDPLEWRGLRPSEGFDQRDYFEVVRDLRAAGTSAYPGLSTATWVPSPPRLKGAPVFPLSGFPSSTIVLCNEAGSYVTYESDRFGFNAPDSQWDVTPAVALVGDSFVEGWCVPRDDSFAALVRRAIPATLNVGYSGHGPLAELGIIREYVAPRRPAWVLWFLYEHNDLGDLTVELATPTLRRYLEPQFSQRLEARTRALGEEMRRAFDARFLAWQFPAPEPPLYAIAELQSLRATIHIARERARSPMPAPPLPLDDLRRVLVEAKRTVNNWGGVLYVVYLPDLAQVLGRRDLTNHGRVVALLHELELPTLDLYPDFINHRAPLSLFPYEEGRHLVETQGLHYSREGHRLVATRVLETLPAQFRVEHPHDVVELGVHHPALCPAQRSERLDARPR